MKAHKLFNTTRSKLITEIDRIAKVKLSLASSVTSLSSQDADKVPAVNSVQNNVRRPKSVAKRKTYGTTTNILNKFVKNDIDENDILDKMEMAQKAIEAHRECINELLQTTTHAPKSISTPMARIRCQASPLMTSIPERNKMNSIQSDDRIENNNEIDNEANHSNRYNKMPNVTTRRVVFVNLDEDS